MALYRVSMGGAVGNAAASDVLTGKTFSSETAGTGIAGTMPNYAGITQGGGTVTKDSSYTYIAIPKKGYYDTTSKVSALNSTVSPASWMEIDMSFNMAGSNSGGQSRDGEATLILNKRYTQVNITAPNDGNNKGNMYINVYRDGEIVEEIKSFPVNKDISIDGCNSFKIYCRNNNVGYVNLDIKLKFTSDSSGEDFAPIAARRIFTNIQLTSSGRTFDIAPIYADYAKLSRDNFFFALNDDDSIHDGECLAYDYSGKNGDSYKLNKKYDPSTGKLTVSQTNICYSVNDSNNWPIVNLFLIPAGVIM